MPSVALRQVLGQQTKTAGCQVNGPYPDKGCTPGDAFPNVSTQELCQSGYTASVRNVTSETKKQIYEEYGIHTHKTGAYEVDHFIPLEIGGSNDISNLWPEAAAPEPGFHEKDIVENYLHEQICSGRMSIQQAQTEIITDWLKVYKSIPNPQKYDFGSWNSK